MKAVQVAAIFLTITLVLVFLVLGQSLLLPLVIAICVWFIVNTIADGLRQIPIGKSHMPHGVAVLLSSFLILGIIFVAIEIIVGAAESLAADAVMYQERFRTVIHEVKLMLGQEELPSFAQLVHDIELKPLAQSVGIALSNAASQVLFVLIYTIFLLGEQSSFPKKLLALSRNRRHYQSLRKTFANINSSIRTYITIKTAICLGQSLLCFVVMMIMGLEFAVFWAFLIFLLNYIPTFGSMIGTLLPTTFAILHFDGVTEIVILALLLWSIQFSMANFLEPKLMGNTLNISTMVVLLSLSLWGLIWGITGMIFSVPITVIIIIVCSEFPHTRSIAIVLSADGDINSPKEVPGIVATGAGEKTHLEELPQ